MTMGFLSWLRGSGTSDITPNDNPSIPPATVGPPDWNPGDPDGVEWVFDEVEHRALPAIVASPWSGWPAGWSTPSWDGRGVDKLVDTAWACLDLNASVLSTMPVYKTQGGRVVTPEGWMTNPDPRLYSSWQEFAKQLFWDYQLGEAFVLATDYYSTGFPMFMRLLPPWSVKAEVSGGIRRYWVGSVEITADVLHIRYSSSLDQPRGRGPLEAGGARMTAAGVLSRYVAELASSPPPFMTIETDQPLNKETATEILQRWIESRTLYAGHPAVMGAGAKLETHQMSAKDMALLELAQFTESRIAVLLGVPPFLVGLPSGGDSMTYSNVSSLFDFHDRASLRPKASAVMSALSNWALPRGQAVDLDRDEYTRPGVGERVEALVKLHSVQAITSDEIRDVEQQLITTGRPVSGLSIPLNGGET